MCEETPNDEWTPFYLVNMDRFPGIDEHVYGYVEHCPNCSETRIRLINIQDIPIVDERNEKKSASTSEPTQDWTAESDHSGLDLTDPDELVD